MFTMGLSHKHVYGGSALLICNCFRVYVPLKGKVLFLHVKKISPRVNHLGLSLKLKIDKMPDNFK